MAFANSGWLNAPTDRLPPERAIDVYIASEGRCYLCGCRRSLFAYGNRSSNWCIEHIVPRVRKGGDDLLNLAVACVPCNVRKGWFSDVRSQGLMGGRQDPVLRREIRRAVQIELVRRRRMRAADPDWPHLHPRPWQRRTASFELAGALESPDRSATVRVASKVGRSVLA